MLKRYPGLYNRMHNESTISNPSSRKNEWGGGSDFNISVKVTKTALACNGYLELQAHLWDPFFHLREAW